MPALTSFTKKSDIDLGNFIQIDPVCYNNLSKGLCDDFYKTLTEDEKKINNFTQCPRGYAVFASKSQFGIRIYPCLRCKGVFAKRLRNTQYFYNPVLSESQLQDLINEDLKTRLFEKQLGDAKEHISVLSHDVKSLNAQIKEHCDAIFIDHPSLSPDEIICHSDAEKIYDRLTTIFLCSSMISSRFAMYDFCVSPEAFIANTRFPCNVYKKFDKVKRIFRNYLKKHVKIQFVGNSFKSIEACSFFEFIPLLLLENAIKYSRENDEITVSFQDADSNLTVTIASFGPHCEPEEMDKIWEKNFRGKYAKTVSDGHGLGLYFVKRIADLHEIEISASTSAPIGKINGIPYSQFHVALRFSNIK